MRQRYVEIALGRKLDVVDIHLSAAGFELLDVLPQFGQVFRADRPRVNLDLLAVNLQVIEDRGPLKREGQFLLGHHVQDQHFVLAVAEVVKGVEINAFSREKIDKSVAELNEEREMVKEMLG